VRTLGALAASYLNAQAEALRAGESRLRDGDLGVHAVRVAARRFRSTLRTYADLYDADAASALDRDLQWYAQTLGAVRDAQVLRQHFRDVLAEFPADLLVGPVEKRIEDELTGDYDHATGILCKELDSPRYAALRADVDRWAEHPPCTRLHERRAKEVESYVQLERQRLRKKLRTVRVKQPDDAAVHGARKAAKRCRYAVELAKPALGKKAAKRLVGRMQAVQDDLGEFQDAVVARDAVLRLRGHAAAAGEDGFTYGLLYAAEQRRADAARRRAGRRSI
jgi:CHAD domain-containing protein